MAHYAGLDVCPEEAAIYVIDDAGRIAKELRAASEPGALIAALQGLKLPVERIGLCAAGPAAICIETRQADAARETMPDKADRNDARALAQVMRTGRFRQVHVKSQQRRP